MESTVQFAGMNLALTLALRSVFRVPTFISTAGNHLSSSEKGVSPVCAYPLYRSGKVTLSLPRPQVLFFLIPVTPHTCAECPLYHTLHWAPEFRERIMRLAPRKSKFKVHGRAVGREWDSV